MSCNLESLYFGHSTYSMLMISLLVISYPFQTEYKLVRHGIILIWIDPQRPDRTSLFVSIEFIAVFVDVYIVV